MTVKNVFDTGYKIRYLVLGSSYEYPPSSCQSVCIAQASRSGHNRRVCALIPGSKGDTLRLFSGASSQPVPQHIIRIWYQVPGMLHDTFLSDPQLRIFVSRFVLLKEVLRAVVRFSFERQDNGIFGDGDFARCSFLSLSASHMLLCRFRSGTDTVSGGEDRPITFCPVAVTSPTHRQTRSAPLWCGEWPSVSNLFGSSCVSTGVNFLLYILLHDGIVRRLVCSSWCLYCPCHPS